MRQLNADAYHDRLAKRRRGHSASVSEAHTRDELCLILAGASGHTIGPLFAVVDPRDAGEVPGNLSIWSHSQAGRDKALSLLLRYTVRVVKGKEQGGDLEGNE
jgi:hypothetical protein